MPFIHNPAPAISRAELDAEWAALRKRETEVAAEMKRAKALMAEAQSLMARAKKQQRR